MENRTTLWSKPHRSQEKKSKHFSYSFLDTSNTDDDPSSPNIKRKLAKAYLKGQTEFEEQLKHNSRNHASSLNQILHRRGKSFENSHMSKQQKSKLGESKIDEEERLKKKVKTLQKTVNKQNEALENVIQKVLKGRDEMKSLTKHIIKDKNKENAIHVLRDKVNDMQHYESQLQDELENQKKVTEDLMHKIHAVKTESAAEIEKAKVHYKEFYTRNLEKEIEQYRTKTLQFSRDKEELLNSLREVEKARDLEKLATLNTDREISKVRHDVEVHKRENTTLKDEHKNLKAYMKEKDERHAQEVEILKNCVEQLRQENSSLKETLEERGKKEQHEKNQLKKTIRDLEEEVSKKEKTGFRTEMNHHDELDHARKQIRKLEEENRLLLEDQRKMEDLKRELKMCQEEFQIKEKHYKEKIEMSKRAQEKRKIEWSSVYNELLQEVKELKQGMGFLENENNRLLSSIDSKSFDQNYSYHHHHH